MSRNATATASAAVAAQAAVEAYVAVHEGYEGSMGVLVHDTLYDSRSGVVIEHEGFLADDAVKAARDAVEAQGGRLVTCRWMFAWEVLV